MQRKQSILRTSVALLSLLLGGCLGTVIAAERPEISRIGPMDTSEFFQVFGENLEGSQVYLWQPEIGDSLPEMAQAVPPAEPTEGVRPQQPAEAVGQVLYADIGRIRGAGVLWLRNEAGWSIPRVFGRAEIWNRSAEEAMPGERLQIFGQNLWVQFRGRPWCVLRSRADGSLHLATWGPVQSQNMPYQDAYKMEVRLPTDVPPGDYDLLVHNGTGGVYGWSDPVPLTILAKRDLIGMAQMSWNRVNLEVDDQELTDFQVARIDIALGDGIQDATNAIETAMEEMAAVGGGIVSLPPGTFGITRTLRVPEGVVIRGAGKEATTLTVPMGRQLTAFWPEISPAARSSGARGWAVDWEPFLKSLTPLVWIECESGLENLTLNGGPGVGMLVLVATVDGNTATRVFFNEVGFLNPDRRPLMPEGEYRPGYCGITVLNATYGFTMWNCSMRAPGNLIVLPSTHAAYMRLIGNTFEDSPRQTSDNVFVRSAYHSMFVGNTFKIPISYQLSVSSVSKIPISYQFLSVSQLSVISISIS